MKVVWSPQALRRLRKLPRDVQFRILDKVEAAARDPLRHFRALKGTSARRLRVGDYRVIADIGKEIHVASVRHRSKAYRKPG